MPHIILTICYRFMVNKVLCVFACSAGEDGEDVDDTERGKRGPDDAVLRRSAHLLLGGSVA